MKILLLWTSLLFAADTLSLQESIAQALQNKYAIRLASLDSSQADNNRMLIPGSFLPKINGVLGGIKTYGVSSTSPKEKWNDIQGSSYIELDYILFDGLRMFYAADLTEGLAQAKELKAKDQVEMAIIEVVVQYLSMLSIQKKIEILELEIKQAQVLVDKSLVKKGLGLHTSRNHIQQEILLNQSLSEKIILKNQHLQAWNSLQLSMGQKDKQTAILQEDLPNWGGVFSKSEWLQKVQTNNSQLNLLTLMEINRRKEIGIQRASYFPWLYFNGKTGRSWTKYDLKNSKTDAQMGLSLRWNIFNGFQNSTGLKNLKIEQRKSLLLKKQQSSFLDMEILALYQEREGFMQRFTFEEKALAFAKQNYELSDTLYRQGSLPFYEWKEAFNLWKKAELRCFEVKLAKFVLDMEMVQLAGILQKETM
jgi:outer membrane protein TolC